ncbi:MAG TPA: DNA polymerase III subunit gamma/tau [Candidatus Magasanikbacteria bacterium]|nr:DNA polymerase III subunit gamma/tau [Candidatus Magasanikbacteria bacterium]
MALYHKHRPQTFDTIIHQEHITTTLKNEITGDKVAHAYLFSGPHGVGKTTTARILAKSLNCKNRKVGDPNPCDQCDSCKDISNSRSIDVIEIDAASQTGVDNVRENIIENAQFKPSLGKYKIFIVDEVHMLSTAAFNALLKTLEEPPQYVVFILATTDAQKLPATVVSRCQRFTFSRIPDETTKKHLISIAKEEGVEIDDAVLNAIVRKSRGGARDAVSLLDQLIGIGEKHITVANASFIMPTTTNETQITFLSHLIEKNTVAGLADIHALSEQGTHPHFFMEEIIQILRLLLITSVDEKLAKKESYLPESDIVTLLELTKKISGSDIVRLIDRSIARMYEVKSSPLPYLPLELLVVEWSAGTASTVNTPTAPAPTPTPQPISPKPITPPVSKPVISPQPPVASTTSKPLEPVVVVEEKDMPPAPESVDMLQVKKAWNALISEIEKTTPSLIFILKNAVLISATGGVLKLTVAYSFHQDKIIQVATRKRIEDHLATILGFRLALEVGIDETMQQKNVAADLNDLATALGGSVI